MNPNASYKIVAHFESRLSVLVLTQRLQSCFEQGAAGSFVLAASDGLEKTVEFTRDAAEDADLVAMRASASVGWRSAAAQQLADELAEICDADLEPVVVALRGQGFELEGEEALEEFVLALMPEQSFVTAEPSFIVCSTILTDQSEVFSVFFVDAAGERTEIYPALDKQDAEVVCGRMNAALAVGKLNTK